MPIPWLPQKPIDRFLETLEQPTAQPQDNAVSWMKQAPIIIPSKPKEQAPRLTTRGMTPTINISKSSPSLLSQANRLALSQRVINIPKQETTLDEDVEEVAEPEPTEKVQWWQKALDLINKPFEYMGKLGYQALQTSINPEVRQRESKRIANIASDGRTDNYDELSLSEKLAANFAAFSMSEEINAGYHALPLWTQILYELPAGLLVPGFAQAAKGLGAVAKVGGTLGKGAGVAGKAIKPLALAEELPGKIIGKAAGAVGKRLGIGVTKLAELDDMETLINVATKPDFARRLANIPAIRPFAQFIGGKAATATTPAQKAVVGYLAQKPEIANKALTAMSNIYRVGMADAVWGRGADDIITNGSLKGKFLHDVLSDKDWLTKYAPNMTPVQKEWASNYREISDLVAPFLRKNGIKVTEMKDYLWSGRKVMAKQGANGEIDEIAFIGSGPSRPGGKIGELKHRQFNTVEEAADKGFVYLSPEDSLHLNLTASYNLVSQKNMKSYLLKNVEWRSIKTPEELKIMVKQMGDDVVETIDKVAMSEPTSAKQLKSLAKAIDRRDKKRIDDLITKLPSSIKGQIRKDYDNWQGALEYQRKTSDFLRKGHFGEASLPYPLFSDVRFTGSDAKEITRTLMDGMETNWNKALHNVNKINAVTRMFALAGDASIFGIQLLPMAVYRPKVFGSTIKSFVKAFTDKEYHINLINKNADVINKSPGMVLAYRAGTEATEALREQGLLNKAITVGGKRVVPGEILARPLQPFARGFEAAMDTAGIELRKSLDHLTLDANGMVNPEKLNQVVSFINEVRGVFNSARLGVSTAQRQVETATLLAPQYMRAMSALLTDVVRGGIRGNEARKAMGSMMASLAALSVAIDLGSGKTPEEAARHLDPTSSDWLTWRIAGQNVGFGTKARSIIQLMGRAVKNPKSLTNMSMSNPAVRFWRYSLSPFVSTGMDVIGGKNAIGEPTRENLLQLTDALFTENLVPIWLQSAVTEGGSLTGRMVRGATEFAGGRTYEMNNNQKRNELREQYALADHKKAYDELNVVEKKQLEMTHQDLEEYTEMAWVDSKATASGSYAEYYNWKDERKQVNTSYSEALYDLQEQFDNGLKTGSQIKESIQKLGTWRAKNFDQIDMRYPELTKRFNESKDNHEELPADYAYDQWVAQFMKGDLELGVDLFDWETYNQRKMEYIGKYGQEMWDYAKLRNQLGLDVPPIMREYRMAQEVLSDYWAIADEATKYYGERDRPAKQNFISRRRRIMRRRNKQIDYYYRLFYTREGVI